MPTIKLLCLLLTVSLPQIMGMSEEMQELIDNLHNTCVGETGVKDEMIDNARKGNFADDENFKCYFKCLFEQMGCMTDDGMVDNDAVIALLPPEMQDKATPIISACKETGSNPCENAWLANKCFQRGAPDQYFLP